MKILYYKDIRLEYLDYIDDLEGIDPYYIYVIYLKEGKEEIGRITFRLGSNQDHYYDGHIGYTIEPPYRGHHFACQACLALKPLILNYYQEVILTCSPDNIASKKTIEKLNTTYLETARIPSHLKKYFTKQETMKCVYKWQLLSLKK